MDTIITDIRIQIKNSKTLHLDYTWMCLFEVQHFYIQGKYIMFTWLKCESCKYIRGCYGF